MLLLNLVSNRISNHDLFLKNRGTAFVVYEDIFDAKNACDHLSGFNVCGRYLVVLYYQPHKVKRLSNELNFHILIILRF